MADVAGKRKIVPDSVFAAWLREELDALNARDGGRRGAQWISDNARDPETGAKAFERVAAQKWMAGANLEASPAARRALAALFAVRRSHINNLIAIDGGYGDQDPAPEWPYWLDPALQRASSGGRIFLVLAADYVVRDEKLRE